MPSPNATSGPDRSPRPNDASTAPPGNETPTDGPTTSSAADTAGADNPPASAERIEELRQEIDWLDAEILRLVKRRVEVSKTIGAARMAAGGPRIVVNREMKVLDRYRDLGPEGRQLAMALLNLGRGRLGHG